MPFQVKGPARTLTGLLAAASAVGLSAPAQAATECAVQVRRIFSGDEGRLWFVFTNGGSASLAANDADKEATLAMAISALLGTRTVTVRYAADGVACTAGDQSLIGFWLN